VKPCNIIASQLTLFLTHIHQPDLHRKHLPVVAYCQLQAALLADPEKAGSRLRWIEEEYKKQEADLDLVLARSCMALADWFWNRSQIPEALEKALKAVGTYKALGMSESVEFVEAQHSVALLQSDAAQEAAAEETLAALRHNSAAELCDIFTIQNLDDHLRLLQVQKQARQESRPLRTAGDVSP